MDIGARQGSVWRDVPNPKRLGVEGAGRVLSVGEGVTGISEGNFAEEVIRLSGGQGVHVVYDGSGPKTFQGSLDSLRISGTFCWFGPVLGAPGPIELMSLPKSIKIGYATFMDHVRSPELLRNHSAKLFDMILAGKLDIRIGAQYLLADAAKAHLDMESRSTTGKLLLIPSQS